MIEAPAARLRHDSRIGVWSGGVAALRLIRAVRALNHRGGLDLRTVAVVDPAGKDLRAAREADEVALLEPGSDTLADALAGARIDALWPGWLASSSGNRVHGATDVCGRLGITLLSPQGPKAPDLRRGREFSLLVVAADWAGNVWTLGSARVFGRGVVIEEFPDPADDPASAAALEALAEAACRSNGFVGVGAIPVRIGRVAKPSIGGIGSMSPTGCAAVEALTGLDLVELELRLAAGEALDGPAPQVRGSAASALLVARPDPAGSGQELRIEFLRLPSGPGIRVDSAVLEGDRVGDPERGEPEVAVITTSGRDAEEARARLRGALEETAALVRSGGTNRMELLQHLAPSSGKAAARARGGQADGAMVALIVAAIQARDAASAVDKAAFMASAARGRPVSRSPVGRAVELRFEGRLYRPVVFRVGPQRYRLVQDGASLEVNVEHLGRVESLVECLGARHRVLSLVEGAGHRIEVDGVPHVVWREESGLVLSPSPAVVIATQVKPGDEVREGEPLLVLEAMKMEMTVVAPLAGRVRHVVGPNSQVDAGTPLVKLDPPETWTTPGQDAGSMTSLDGWSTNGHRAGAGGGTAEPSLLADLARIHELVLGFEIPDADAAQLPRSLAERYSDPTVAVEQVRRAEDEILASFADMSSLFRGQLPSEDVAREQAHAPEQDFFVYLRSLDASHPSLPGRFLQDLQRALGHYGVRSVQRTPELEEALFRMFCAQQRMPQQVPAVMAILERRMQEAGQPAGMAAAADESFHVVLDRIVQSSIRRWPALHDLARETRYRYFDQPLLEELRARVYEETERQLDLLERDSDGPGRDAAIEAAVLCPQPMKDLLIERLHRASRPRLRQALLEAILRRYYRIRDMRDVRSVPCEGTCVVSAVYEHDGSLIRVLAVHGEEDQLPDLAASLVPLVDAVVPEEDVVIDFYLWHQGEPGDPDLTAAGIAKILDAAGFTRPLRRVMVAMAGPGRELGAAITEHFTFRLSPEGYREQGLYRGLHPMMGKRLQLWRLSNFWIDRLPSVEDVYLFHGVARDNPKDERLFALAEVRDMTPIRDADGRITALPHLERMLTEALAAIRRYQSHLPPRRRLLWNRVLLYIRPPIEMDVEKLFGVMHKLAPLTDGSGLEKVVVRAQIRNALSGELKDTVLHVSNPAGRGLSLRFDSPADAPIRPLTEYMQKVVQTRQRGLVYPYEIVRMLTPSREGNRADYPPGDFVEHDLDESGNLVPVDRPYGENSSNIIVGVIRNFTEAYPEGMTRVALLGDPSRALGSLAEAECRRIIAGLDLAEQLGVPLEWYAVSAGAKISMGSGTENMDWIGWVLRRLIEFTQAGGEVNVVVAGINVGAQPYWNAEATMLMHTKGILIMTPDSAMVLTGKQALDYSGGVSAEDNFGIGGYERVMGPNGQAQYWAPDIDEACHLLLRHYELTYVAPGELFPRRVATKDATERDVRTAPHLEDGSEFSTIGQVFSDEFNPGRKKPFDIRSVMRAVADQDHQPLERWGGMRDAEIAVVWDACLGGYPVELIGLESKPLPRRGFVPADGPEIWTAGTLFPKSSKKVARAVNAASGRRPVVVLANLSGFDGSPESLRELQLEYGAEIGRAVVNFKGPMVFCVVSRYHGGAFVVFSSTLNEGMEVAALEGSFASVIGGAPAAAVVFTRDVDSRTKQDPRVAELESGLREAEGAEKALLRSRLQEVTADVRNAKLGEVAAEFDGIHTIYRAQQVGSVHRIIAPDRLRPYLIDAVERGIARYAGADGS